MAGTSTVTIRMSDDDKTLIERYASIYGLSVSEFVRSAALEAIEDAMDVDAYRRAMAEFEADPVTYTNDEAMRMLGLR